MDVTGLSETESIKAREGVYLTLLAKGERMNVVHVRMEPGSTVPDHTHHHEQIGYVVSGEITFFTDESGFEDEDEFTVGPGNSYWIPSEEPHGGTNRGDEDLIALDIFAPPRVEAPYQE